MKDQKRSDILEMIFPICRARILRTLFSRPNKPRYLSELAQLNGIAVGTAQEELASLLATGLITTYFGGYRRYYRVNRDHRLFSHLLGLVHDADKLPPVNVSDLRRNRRRKAGRKKTKKQPSYPIRSHFHSAYLAGLH